ncbi:MAG: FixH family protein [Betaproteobacteria bacterium]
MKKHSLVVLSAVIAVTMLFGCSKGYESRKSAEELSVTLSVERYPLVKGDNALTVKVKDASGKVVTDGTVNVHYFMPPMPGMAPMDYNTQAMLKGDAYVFSANIPMEGGWKVEVSVARPGKQAATATFNIDAR